ncbi:hypothetical protein J6590_000687 [Homalodisca vitripennis]|nr:hypothetical protein J6590_000687 [Homalodisca vitripennis]
MAEEQTISTTEYLDLIQITEKDKELARAVWTEVEKDYRGTGILLFTELFTTYPDYVKYFERMKSSPDQDIFESARFKKHMVSALFPSIALMLKNLDHPSELSSQLHEIAVKHKRRGLRRSHFEVLQEVIMTTLKKAFGEAFTADTESAWNKILTVAFDGISTTIEKTEL